ncbi:MAG: hypothetical protein SFT91_01595 [Rickettsiaceae bacterium]|nr:hypothetical protein [Rickettsiaceae bacterium]
MRKRDLTPNYDAKIAVREFMSITNKFINYLIKIDNLLDQSKIQDAISSLETMQLHSEAIAKFKDQLPDKLILAEENLLDPMITQQNKLDKISENVEFKLNVHLEIARKINELAKARMKEEKANEMGYDSTGKIGSNVTHLDPAICLKEV